MLELKDVRVAYGNIEVLHKINIEVKDGEIVTIIGANGAGKTTTLRSTAGLLPKKKGSSIIFDGKDITNMGAEKIVAEGMALSPEGRHIFPDLTVQDNLEMGAYLRYKDKEGVARDLKNVFEMFPRLEERRKQLGKTLSGGEQQMLAIGRALMSSPKMLLLDEPSMGLSPIMTQQVFSVLKQLKADGITIFLIEQNAYDALEISDRAYIMETGRITLEGPSSELITDERVKSAYLGGDV